MEKAKEHREENSISKKRASSLAQQTEPKSQVWDCGSSLYDSFELNSFKRQLDSAISCRTMSMPHLSDRRRADPLPPGPPPPKQTPASVNKKSSKISRSLNKLLRSVFKSRSPVFRVKEQSGQDGFLVVYDKSGALTTIPEVPEIDFGGLSPEIGSLVRRTGSARFTAASNIGISCA